MTASSPSRRKHSTRTQEAVLAYQKHPSDSNFLEVREAVQGLFYRHLRSCPTHVREDLYQEFQIDLFRALERYDPTRGTAFSSYLFSYLLNKRAVTLHASGLVRPPQTMDSLARLRKMKRAYDNGEDVVALAKELAADVQHLTYLDVIQAYLCAYGSVASLDQTIPGTENLRLADVIADAFEDPTELLIAEEQRAYIQRAFEEFPERTKGLLQGRFLEGKTLQVVGDEWGISRERARQIIDLAVEVLQKRREFSLRRSPKWEQK